MSDTPYACWAISAAQPEHVVRQFEQADHEIAQLRAERDRWHVVAVEMATLLHDAKGIDELRKQELLGRMKT